jgi:hypothetical protein
MPVSDESSWNQIFNGSRPFKQSFETDYLFRLTNVKSERLREYAGMGLEAGVSAPIEF